MIPIQIRDSVDTDKNMILKTWKTTFRHAPQWRHLRRTQSWHLYWEYVNRICDRLLEKHGARVACNPCEDHQVLGWVCSNADVVHYVWVKHHLRQLGIARQLLESLDETVTKASHWTPICESVCPPNEIIYAPSTL